MWGYAQNSSTVAFKHLTSQYLCYITRVNMLTCHLQSQAICVCYSAQCDSCNISVTRATRQLCQRCVIVAGFVFAS